MGIWFSNKCYFHFSLLLRRDNYDKNVNKLNYTFKSKNGKQRTILSRIYILNQYGIRAHCSIYRTDGPLYQIESPTLLLSKYLRTWYMDRHKISHSTLQTNSFFPLEIS